MGTFQIKKKLFSPNSGEFFSQKYNSQFTNFKHIFLLKNEVEYTYYKVEYPKVWTYDSPIVYFTN